MDQIAEMLPAVFQLGIGMVTVGSIVFYTVEAIKGFGVSGNVLRVAAIATGFLFAGIGYGLDRGLFGPTVEPWVLLFVMAFFGAVGAMGYYDRNKPVDAGSVDVIIADGDAAE